MWQFILIFLIVIAVVLALKILTSALFWFTLLVTVAIYATAKILRWHRERATWRVAYHADDIDARLDRLEVSMRRLTRRLSDACRWR